MHGFDGVGAARLGQLVAQIAQVAVQRPVGYRAACAPDRRHQIGAQCQLCRIAHEAGKQVEFGAGQCDLRLSHATDAAMQVQRQPSMFQPRRRSRAAGAFQDGLDPRDQFARAEGFCDVIIRTQFQPQNAVDLIVAGGQEQDRHIGTGADATAGFEPVHMRQAHIQNDQIGCLTRGQGQSSGAVGRDDHRMTGAFQREANQIAQPGIVM